MQNSDAQGPQEQVTTEAAPAPASLVTTINRGWMIKMVVIMLAFLGFGGWGLYDATIAYPARGERAASYFRYQYFQSLDAAKDGSLLTQASVDDPVAALTSLEAKGENLSATDRVKRQWLQQLKLIGRLNPTHTAVSSVDVSKVYGDLGQQWQSAIAKKQDANELTWYDIPSQWLITAVGFGVAIYMAALLMGVMRVKYGWEPALERLTLPRGEQLVPADIAEFDKRKWDKFLIFLKIKPEHPQLGGREVRLDLLRYAGLEDWILTMERRAFPETATDTHAASHTDAPASSDPASQPQASGDQAAPGAADRAPV